MHNCVVDRLANQVGSVHDIFIQCQQCQPSIVARQTPRRRAENALVCPLPSTRGAFPLAKVLETPPSCMTSHDVTQNYFSSIDDDRVQYCLLLPPTKPEKTSTSHRAGPFCSKHPPILLCSKLGILTTQPEKTETQLLAAVQALTLDGERWRGTRPSPHATPSHLGKRSP